MAIWYTLWSFGNLVAVWYFFHRFGILSQEKYGNPDGNWELGKRVG
jgi:hypothetical protein